MGPAHQRRDCLPPWVVQKPITAAKNPITAPKNPIKAAKNQITAAKNQISAAKNKITAAIILDFTIPQPSLVLKNKRVGPPLGPWALSLGPKGPKTKKHEV